MERIVTDLNRTSILIAENKVLTRNLISTILNNEGHLVLAAANNAEALELSRTFAGEIRLLITKSGQLAETIARERPAMRVILLSASMSSDLEEAVRKVDPAAFLQRGALPPRLSERIQRALTDPNFGGAFVEV
jgi:CheY-like chemotaxis protein